MHAVLVSKDKFIGGCEQEDDAHIAQAKTQSARDENVLLNHLRSYQGKRVEIYKTILGSNA